MHHVLAEAVGEHLGGGGDLGDGDLEMPAAGEDLFEPDLLVGGQVIGAQSRRTRSAGPSAPTFRAGHSDLTS
ncbi:hypothetical protein ACWPOB_03400 [Rhodococcus sp. 2H158]